jgi:hypothetical protein
MQKQRQYFVVVSFGLHSSLQQNDAPWGTTPRSKGKYGGNGKNNGKRREASLRQSGSAFGAAVIGRAEALPFRFAIS